MSKAITASLIGVVGAGGSVTMAYAFGAFNDPAFLSEDLKGFKDAGGGTCAQSLFPGLKLEGGTKLDVSGNKVDSTGFSSTESSVQAEGCLIVNWDKNSYDNGKGNGNFRGSGSFKQGDKGFVMFASAKPNGSTQELNLTGGFYYVTKSSTGGADTWSVNKYDEIETSGGKKITKNKFDTEFPSVGSSLQNSSKLGNDRKTNGGFVADKNEFDNICADGDGCSAKTPKSRNGFRGYGTWKTDTSASSNKQDLSKGSTNFDTWLSNMYEKSSKLDLSNVFTSIKGDWE